MVKLFVMAAIITVTTSAVAEKMTYDEFVREVGVANRKVDHSKRLVNKDELEKWIVDSRIQGATGADSKKGKPGGWMPDLTPKPEGGESPAEVPPDIVGERSEADKSDDREKAGHTDSNEEQALSGALPQPAAKPKATTNSVSSGPVRYVWKPQKADGGSQAVTYSMSVEGPDETAKFGIPIGTQIKVRLSSGATSVQPGMVKVTVMEDVMGMRKVLERGSTIFVRPNAVRGSDRLYAVARRGITLKNNEEFSVNGNIFAEDGQPGFVAEVISDGEAVDRAIDKGAKAVGEGLIGLIPSDSISLEASKKAAGSMLNEADGQAQEERGRVKLVVQAQPQYGVLQIEETF